MMQALRIRFAMLASLQLLVSCGAHQSSGQGQPPDRGNAEHSTALMKLTGQIFVTGNEPAASITLLPAQGGTVDLTGELQRELARLSGAEVWVEGVHRNPKAREFDVYRYEILKVDGEVPKVGTLTMRTGVLALVGRDTLELINAPDDLLNKVGAKVWIVGDSAGNRLAVQSYGVIREAGE
jgi:hypothetical protein